MTIMGPGVPAARAESPPPLPSVLWMHLYTYFPSGFARGQEPPDQKIVPSERVSCGNAALSLRQMYVCCAVSATVICGSDCTNHGKMPDTLQILTRVPDFSLHRDGLFSAPNPEQWHN